MLWYRGFAATPFDICVGASYAERGMRRDDHDAFGLACMLSMPPGSKAAEEAPADAAAKAAEDCPASSWPGPDGKCPKMARFQPFELKLSPRGFSGTPSSAHVLPDPVSRLF